MGQVFSSVWLYWFPAKEYKLVMVSSSCLLQPARTAYGAPELVPYCKCIWQAAALFSQLSESVEPSCCPKAGVLVRSVQGFHFSSVWGSGWAG